VLLELLCSALIGLGLALAALHRYPRRFAHRRLTLATGPAAAALGALLAHAVLGGGQPVAGLLTAAAFTPAILSLLVSSTRRPGPRLAQRPVR
jgi:hypothetical protein